MNEKTSVILAVCVALFGFAIIIFTFHMAIKESGEGRLDERQMIQRGKAWRDTGIAMLCLCALAVLVEIFDLITMSAGVAPYLIFSIGLGFFSADNIVRGAFFGFKSAQWKPTPIWVIGAQAAITLLGAFLTATDTYMIIGTWQTQYLNVIALVAFAIPIVIGYLIRKRIERKEEL